MSHFYGKGTSDQKNLNLSVSETYFVSQISQPPKMVEKWFCIQNLRMDLSFQGEKNNLPEDCVHDLTVCYTYIICKKTQKLKLKLNVVFKPTQTMVSVPTQHQS